MIMMCTSNISLILWTNSLQVFSALTSTRTIGGINVQTVNSELSKGVTFGIDFMASVFLPMNKSSLTQAT